MSRINAAIVGSNTDLGITTAGVGPALDLRFGGQMGYMNNLTQFVSNQAYVRKQLVAILLEAPLFMQVMPQPDQWVQTLKALVEVHPRTIEGLKSGLTVETDEHPAGGAGEMQQEYIDVKRNRSEPAFTYVEKYGMPIYNFFYDWITFGMMDPDTKFALINTLSTGPVAADLLADWYTMTVLFYEPDPSNTKVNKAWICTNMFPKGTGDIEGKRDLTTAGEMNTLNIEFTAISQYNYGTKLFAQSILDSMNMTNANPNLRLSFVQSVSPDVAAANNGFQDGLENVGFQSVTSV